MLNIYKYHITPNKLLGYNDRVNICLPIAMEKAKELGDNQFRKQYPPAMK